MMNSRISENAGPNPRFNRFPFLDNIHTTVFTPPEHQVELLDTAKTKNVAVCLASSASKSFITIMLIKEFAHEARGTGRDFKRSFILANNAPSIEQYCELIRDHSDLLVTKVLDSEIIHHQNLWLECLNSNHVVVTFVDYFVKAFSNGFLNPSAINFLLVDECHLAILKHPCQDLMALIPRSNGTRGPRIVGMSTSVLGNNCDPATLSRRLKRLEQATGCVPDTSSSLVLLSRYSNRPEELVIESYDYVGGAVDQQIRNLVNKTIVFLKDHVYSPEEIYGNLDEDVPASPDPTTAPLAFLNDLLEILESLGPWCTERAAWFFMKELKKHKDKAAYERHYLLLSVVFTVMEAVRAICDYHFRSCVDEKERMLTFVTPKVLRLLEIFKFYKPVTEDVQEVQKQNGVVGCDLQLKSTENPSLCVHFNNKGCDTCNVTSTLKTSDLKPLHHSSTSSTSSSSTTSSSFCCCDYHSSENKITREPPSDLLLPKCCCCSEYTNLSFCDRNCLSDCCAVDLKSKLTSKSSHCDLQADRIPCKLNDSLDRSGTKCHENPRNILGVNIVDSLQGCKNFTEGDSAKRSPDVADEELQLNHFCKTRKQCTYMGCNRFMSKKPVLGLHNISVGQDIKIGRHLKSTLHNNGPSRPVVINDDPSSLWGIVFVDRRYSACILNMYLKEISKHHPDYRFLSPNFIMGQRQLSFYMNGSVDPKEAQMEHRKQEEVLRRFRMHESNLLIATSVVEQGVDLPKCNLVVRFDLPRDYKCYTQSKGRAKAIPSRYFHLVEQRKTAQFLREMFKFRALEEILLSRCHGREIPVDEEVDLKEADQALLPYYPNPLVPSVKVTMSTAISVVNRYCARLPSDTFTRLVPRCVVTTISNEPPRYKARIHLPINSPIKEPSEGPAMASVALAKLAAALEACKVLHRSGELDDNLMLVGKVVDAVQKEGDSGDDEEVVPEGSPRPGTTKRRRYYNKQTALAFQHCLPTASSPCHLYRIYMKLTCPIPEEQNIRGRQIYEPNSTPQGLGILTSKKIPEICGFPVFTRSGEVAVQLLHLYSDLWFSQAELDQLSEFHRYTFTNVLRLEKYPMCYDMETAENSLMIVPLNVSSEDENVFILDWDFVTKIMDHKDKKPEAISETERKNFQFDVQLYQDAVVMPWYRNLDQPQYFYVAEVCYHLSPQSDFPDDDFETFEKYYLKKYGITIQSLKQPLLDVDHTSARLNLLTPRYVNRKGVALPTSSEETKRAKRENLQQKQILVPELCTIHPFSASLWRKTVCLPCILYRLNCLLLSEELRVRVTREIGFGKLKLDDGQHWPMLDFGWSLSDVVKARKLALEESKTRGKQNELLNGSYVTKSLSNQYVKKEQNSSVMCNGASDKGKSDRQQNLQGAFSIGTWSNDMACLDNDASQKADSEGFGSTNCSQFSFEITTKDTVNWTTVPNFEFEDDEEIYNTLINRDSPEIREPFVRYGSPSNFESNDWDLDNDLEYDVMDIPGFGLISAPDGGFNIADLSRDLEAIEKTVYPPNGVLNNRDNVQSKKNIADTLSEMDGDEDDNDVEVEEEDDDDDDDGCMSGQFEGTYWTSGSSNSVPGVVKELQLDEGGGTENEWCSSFDWEAVKDECNEEYMSEENWDNREKQDHAERKIKLIAASKSLDLEQPESVTQSTVATTTAAAPCQGSVETSLQSSSCDNFYCTTNNVNTSSVNDSTVILSQVAKMEGMCSGVWVEKNEMEDKNTEVHLRTNSHSVGEGFSFDYQPDLSTHPGPSPSVLLQALTMSNANDGINLERLETIGDSFLKHAITTYLFCKYPNIHEGKLSHLRSKQVSNLKLYKLGRKKGFAHCMVATKFEPNDNWLPPGYVVPKELEQALIDSGIPAGYWNIAKLPGLTEWKGLDAEQIKNVLAKHGEELKHTMCDPTGARDSAAAKTAPTDNNLDVSNTQPDAADMMCFIPYNLMTQHSIPDKSIADCVEAQIGAYLTSCGPRGALLFMSWLGIDVLPKVKDALDHICYGYFKRPPSPLHYHGPDVESQLEVLLHGYDKFEERIGYRFRDRSYLLQAFTHASYHYNRLTDCYQRLEFLGDAVLDYLITRHLYEDKRQHSPGTLTDLRSALVNNTIFATLAVRYDFHKYFKALCSNLFMVIDRFVRMQKENGHRVNEEYYFMEEEECEEVEDIEVPKALGDVFESVAGAIYLDSNMSLDTVWRVYYAMMKSEIELFSTCVPKSPIRELLEKEPETAKFGKPERTLDGKVRVTVEVFGKGCFTALGRNYRIAKCTAAKHALKALRKFQRDALSTSAK